MGRPDVLPAIPTLGSTPKPVEAEDGVVERPVPDAPSEPEPTGSVDAISPSAEPVVESAPAINVSFDQLKKVWPGLFGSLRDVLGARRWAYFREAIPVAVDGNVIVLEVAHDFHYQSLRADDAVTAIVATRASDLLGGEVRVRFQVKEGGSPADSPEDIDLDELEERDTATDPTELLAAELGAEVVDE